MLTVPYDPAPDSEKDEAAIFLMGTSLVKEAIITIITIINFREP
jgi:hypothetical protein